MTRVLRLEEVAENERADGGEADRLERVEGDLLTDHAVLVDEGGLERFGLGFKRGERPDRRGRNGGRRGGGRRAGGGTGRGGHGVPWVRGFCWRWSQR